MVVKKKALVPLFAALTILFSGIACSAGVLLTDDFEPYADPVDPAKWTNCPGKGPAYKDYVDPNDAYACATSWGYPSVEFDLPASLRSVLTFGGGVGSVLVRAEWTMGGWNIATLEEQYNIVGFIENGDLWSTFDAVGFKVDGTDPNDPSTFEFYPYWTKEAPGGGWGDEHELLVVPHTVMDIPKKVRIDWVPGASVKWYVEDALIYDVDYDVPDVLMPWASDMQQMGMTVDDITISTHRVDPDVTKFTYRGLLADDAGVPVPDGTHSFVFAFSHEETGGAALWTSSPIGVDTKDGRFTTIVDGIPADAVFDGTDVWMEVSVGGETLSPRTNVTEAPYASRAFGLAE